MKKMKILRLALYGIAVFMIVYAASYKIIRAEMAANYGKTMYFKIRGYDPYDAFRGRYIRFNMERIDDDIRFKSRFNRCKYEIPEKAFIVLKPGEDGLTVYDCVLDEKPESGDYLEVRRNRYNYEPPFERFYINEEIAPEAEKIAMKAVSEDKLRLKLKVYKGFAVIEDLCVGEESLRGLAVKDK